MNQLGSFQGAASLIQQGKQADQAAKVARQRLFAGRTPAEQELLAPVLAQRAPVPVNTQTAVTGIKQDMSWKYQRDPLFGNIGARNFTPMSEQVRPYVNFAKDLYDTVVRSPAHLIASGGKGTPLVMPRFQQDVKNAPTLKDKLLTGVGEAMIVPFGKASGKASGNWSKWNPKTGDLSPTINEKGMPIRYGHGTTEVFGAPRTPPSGTDSWPLPGIFHSDSGNIVSGYANAASMNQHGAPTKVDVFTDVNAANRRQIDSGVGYAISEYYNHPDMLTKGTIPARGGNRIPVGRIGNKASDFVVVKPAANPKDPSRVTFDLFNKKTGKLIVDDVGVAQLYRSQAQSAKTLGWKEPRAFGVHVRNTHTPDPRLGLGGNASAYAPNVRLHDISSVVNPLDLDRKLTNKMRQRLISTANQVIDEHAARAASNAHKAFDSGNIHEMELNRVLDTIDNMFARQKEAVSDALRRGREVNARYEHQKNTLLAAVYRLNEALSTRGVNTFTREGMDRQRLSAGVDARHVLKKLGYDGAHHLGGPEADHRVVIAFNKEQIKPFFQGTQQVATKPPPIIGKLPAMRGEQGPPAGATIYPKGKGPRGQWHWERFYDADTEKMMADMQHALLPGRATRGDKGLAPTDPIALVGPDGRRYSPVHQQVKSGASELERANSVKWKPVGKLGPDARNVTDFEPTATAIGHGLTTAEQANARGGVHPVAYDERTLGLRTLDQLHKHAESLVANTKHWEKSAGDSHGNFSQRRKMALQRNAASLDLVKTEIADLQAKLGVSPSAPKVGFDQPLGGKAPASPPAAPGPWSTGKDWQGQTVHVYKGHPLEIVEDPPHGFILHTGEAVGGTIRFNSLSEAQGYAEQKLRDAAADLEKRTTHPPVDLQGEIPGFGIMPPFPGIKPPKSMDVPFDQPIVGKAPDTIPPDMGGGNSTFKLQQGEDFGSALKRALGEKFATKSMPGEPPTHTIEQIIAALGHSQHGVPLGVFKEAPDLRRFAGSGIASRMAANLLRGGHVKTLAEAHTEAQAVFAELWRIASNIHTRTNGPVQGGIPDWMLKLIHAKQPNSG